MLLPLEKASRQAILNFLHAEIDLSAFLKDERVRVEVCLFCGGTENRLFFLFIS